MAFRINPITGRLDLVEVASGGGGTPGGSDGQVQYNNGGSFGGAATLYWNDVNNWLGLGAVPTALFDITGGDEPYIVLSPSAGVRFRVKNYNNIADFYFDTGSDTVASLRNKDASGTFKLGIQTISPAYTLDVDGDIHASGDIYNNDTIGTNAIKTYKGLFSAVNSAGKFTGGEITDNGDGTVSVSAGTGLIKSTDSDTGDVYSISWDTNSSVSLTDNATNYIMVQYNSGSPQITASTSLPSDHNTNILLGLVYRDGTDLHITTAGQWTANYAEKTLFKDLEINGKFQRVSGLMLSETGTRNIAVSAGLIYAGLTKVNLPAIDTSGSDTFIYYYRDGSGGWTKVTGQTQIDNLHYDDGSGTLAELSDPIGWRTYYGVHWVYQDADGDVMVVYGQDNYLLTDAQNAQPPSQLPDIIEDIGGLIGKIIIEKNASSFESVESAFTQKFTPATVSEHNKLSGLQGGTSDQYYHLAEVDTTGLSDGYILKWDATNSKWVVAAESGGGSGSPGGTNSQLQYNDGGSFGGAKVYYDDSTEETGFRESSPSAVVDARSRKGSFSSITYTGSSGLNDMSIVSNYSGTESHTYTVNIFSTGTPDRIRVFKDGVVFGGSVYSLTTDPIEIEEGITIQFANTTGHASGDQWEFSTTGTDPAFEVKDYDGNVVYKVSGTGEVYVHRQIKPVSAAKGLRLSPATDAWGVVGVVQGAYDDDYAIIPTRISTPYSPDTSAVDVGKGAVDLCPYKQYSTDTARGDCSGVFVGYRNRVDTAGTYSAVIAGNLDVVTGEQSVILGGRSNTISANGKRSVILAGRESYNDAPKSVILGGRYIRTRWEGEVSYGASYISYVKGSTQASLLTMAIQTTDGTTTEMKISPYDDPAQLELIDNMTIGYTIHITARQTDGTAGTIGDSHRWVYEGLAKRGSGASTMEVVANSLRQEMSDDDASGWSVDISADTTNGALKIEVTGEANKTIKWLARIEMEILTD